MFGMRASGTAASWVVGWMGTDAHLYDDPEDAAILALLDSRFDAHLILRDAVKWTSSYHYRTSVGDWGMGVMCICFAY
ncbi:AP3-complex subunit beta-A [Hordeum vulgare]|nr:AP3-complex subunit beta-A [Hordeum vulgare]